MEKTFTLTIKMQPHDSPQQWIFSAGVSGLEQLAIWTIIAHLSQQEMNKILNSGK